MLQSAGPAAHAVRRARLLDPALPGPVDRAADHDRRGDVAQSRPTSAGRRAGCSALYTVGAIVGLVLAGRFLLRPAVPPDRQSRRARDVRLRRPVHRHRQRRGDGAARPVDRAGRLHRRRDARRFALPARARGRRRAVPLDPARPVLPRRRHDARPPRHRRAAVLRDRHGAGADRDQGGGDHGPRHGVPDGLAAGARASACCSARAASSASSCSPQAQQRAADRARGGEPVRRDRHPVDGDDALPDDGDPAAARRAGQRRRSASGPVADGSNAIIVGYGRFGQTVGADADRAGHRASP